MLLRIPHFYPQFRCIADKCTDTCCVGWEIDVDEKTLGKYKDLAAQYESAGQDRSHKEEHENGSAPFAQKVLQNIKDGHFILKQGDRCPFLMENGLCEMICKMGCNGTDLDEHGENVLCDICREHPRFVEVYGDIMEKGIGLCCEEGVRLLLTSNPQQSSAEPPLRHPFGKLRAGSERSEGSRDILPLTECEVDDVPDEMPEGVEEARDAIFQEREAIFALLSDRSKPLNQRLLEVLDFAEAVSTIEEAEPSPASHPFGKLRAGSERSYTTLGASPLSGSYPLCGEGPSNSSPAYFPPQWLNVLSEGESYGPAWDAAFLRMQNTLSSRHSEQSTLFEPACHSERSTKCEVEESSLSSPTCHPFGKLRAGSERSEGSSSPAPEPLTTKSLFSEEDGARIVSYLIFRYYAKSLFDGDSITKVLFAVYFWILLNRFGKELAGVLEGSGPLFNNIEEILTAKINAVKLLSKQTEYSEEIMEILADHFYQDEAFSLEQFRSILASSAPPA